MPENTSRGYTYPLLSDVNSFPAQIQDMATDIDADVQAVFNRIVAGYNFAACSVQAFAVNQSVANNTDVTATYDTELYDNAAMFTVGVSASNVNITVTGLYLVIGRATFTNAAAGATGREIRLVNSGVPGIFARKSIDGNEGLPNTTSIQLANLVHLTSGTTLTMTQRQNTGAAINTTVRQLMVAKMGDL